MAPMATLERHELGDVNRVKLGGSLTRNGLEAWKFVQVSIFFQFARSRLAAAMFRTQSQEAVGGRRRPLGPRV